MPIKASPNFFADCERLLHHDLQKAGVTPAGIAMFGYAMLLELGQLPESEKYPGKRLTPAEFLAEALKDVPIEDRLKAPKKKGNEQ